MDHPQRFTDKLVQRYDTRVDDWDTEVFNDVIGRQLKTLTCFTKQPQQTHLATPSKLVADYFRCETLQARNQYEALGDAIISVHRWNAAESSSRPIADLHSTQELVDARGKQKGIHNKLKLFQIQKTDTLITGRL